MSQLGQVNGGLLDALSVSVSSTNGTQSSITLDSLDGSFSNLLANTENELLSPKNTDTFAEVDDLQLLLSSSDSALNPAFTPSGEVAALAVNAMLNGAGASAPLESEAMMAALEVEGEAGNLLPQVGQPLPAAGEGVKSLGELPVSLQALSEIENALMEAEEMAATLATITTTDIVVPDGMQQDLQKSIAGAGGENVALLQQQNLKQQQSLRPTFQTSNQAANSRVDGSYLNLEAEQGGSTLNSSSFLSSNNKEGFSLLSQNQVLTVNAPVGETPTQAFAKILESSASSSSELLSTNTDSAVDKGEAILAKLQAIPVSYRSSAGISHASTFIQAPVAAPQWGEAVAERMAWFSMKSVNIAELKLDPPELGPLQVRITTQGDQTTINFTSQHLAVREALDQSLPRLREIFSENGLNLADVDVSSQGNERDRQKADAEDSGLAGSDSYDDSQDGVDAEKDGEPNISAANIGIGLVDDYA